MNYQTILRLRKMVNRATDMHRALESPDLDHERISLPVGEAIIAAARLEAFLSDILMTAETEIFKLDVRRRPKG